MPIPIPTSAELLADMAEALGLSVSEVAEKISDQSLISQKKTKSELL